MDVSAIALQGLDQAQAKLEKTAIRLASLGGDAQGSLPTDTVDLSAIAVDLISARNEFAVNIQVLRTADEIYRQTIDLLA